jgi:hypothetical protein
VYICFNLIGIATYINNDYKMKIYYLMRNFLFYLGLVCLIGCTIGLSSNYKEEEYIGLIKDKSIDRINHATECIIYINDKCENKLVARDWPGLWDYCSVGDSIFKFKGVTKMIVKKSNKEIKEFNFYK